MTNETKDNVTELPAPAQTVPLQEVPPAPEPNVTPFGVTVNFVSGKTLTLPDVLDYRAEQYYVVFECVRTRHILRAESLEGFLATRIEPINLNAKEAA